MIYSCTKFGSQCYPIQLLDWANIWNHFFLKVHYEMVFPKNKMKDVLSASLKAYWKFEITRKSSLLTLPNRKAQSVLALCSNRFTKSFLISAIFWFQKRFWHLDATTSFFRHPLLMKMYRYKEMLESSTRTVCTFKLICVFVK